MTNKVFEEKYNNLNKAQREAVDSIDGPVMVIAGPGTGKTTVLTLRIANILQKTDTPANSILAITYTDAGVKSMRNKLYEIIGDRAYDVKIHTFHGFASSIISEYPDHFIHLNKSEQLSDIDQEIIIRDIIKDDKFVDLRPLGDTDYYISKILSAIESAKRDAMSPEYIRTHSLEKINEIKNDEENISTRGASKGQLKAEAKVQIKKHEKTILFADVYEKYDDIKKNQSKLDFNDLIIELLTALKDDELLLRLVQEKYLYIHVDEHQDTNDSQNFIVSLIADFFESPNVFIVGDEKQAIYRFQGASVDNFMSLHSRWQNMKSIKLDMNYRSHQGILDSSFSVIERNYNENTNNDLRVKLKSGVEEEIRPIDIVGGENILSTEKYLIDEIVNLVSKNDNSSIAIIVKRNRDINRLINLFNYHNIPVTSERSIDIFNHPIGKLFFDFIEYLNDETRLDLLARTIVAGMWNMNINKSFEILRKIRSNSELDFNSDFPNLIKIRDKYISDSPIVFLIESAELSGYTKIVSKDVGYIDIWRGIINLAESLLRESDISDSKKLIDNLLAYRQASKKRSVKISIGTQDSQVQIMTAHKSKGLEFDYVFMPYANEEVWIGRNHGSSFILPRKDIDEEDDSNIEDIRRLFYVAMTRARKHLTILTSSEENSEKRLTPIRFIKELDEKVSNIHLPKLNTEELYNRKIIKENDSSNIRGLLDLSKRTLIEKGLSVTALNHFKKCPNKFIFQSILKLPQAPNSSSEKGNAMHGAINTVWKMENRSIENITNTLLEEVSKYFAKSFLNSFDKEIVKKELFNNIPKIAKSLYQHFNTNSDAKIYSEMPVKTEFSTLVGENRVSIPIHGKLDAIIEHAESIYVFDYKTTEAMSINKIKGDTKDSDGNYFRQLIFYKMLIASELKWRYKSIFPSLVFLNPDKSDNCSIVNLPIEKEDIDSVKSDIESLIKSVWTGDIVKSKCDDAECEFCGLFRLI